VHQRLQEQTVTTRIGVFSDPHATLAPVRAALAVFAREGVQRVFCAGDISGYGDELEATLAVIEAHQVESIHGNHDLWYLRHQPQTDPPTLAASLQTLPAVIETRIEGCSLYMVHASPPRACEGGIRLLDEHGALLPESVADWRLRLGEFGHDVLVVGHTHQVFAEQLGKILVINPGSTLFNHSCAVLSLPQRRVEFFPLCGKDLLRSWNWGINPLPGTARDIYAGKHLP